MSDFLTLDDLDFKDKTVLLRVDINVPVDKDTKKISESKRIDESTVTIRELAVKGAKVVVIAHQGRAGDYDFLPLDQHAEALESILGEKFGYVDDAIGVGARDRIKSLQSGEILLLQNIRFLAEETLELGPEAHAKGILVSRLSSLADLFVNDAFPSAHRSHASIVGLTATLPSAAGRIMEKELRYDRQAISDPKHPVVYVLGGGKPDDNIKVLKHGFQKGIIDRVLSSGVLGLLFMVAREHNLGDETMNLLQNKGHLEQLQEVRKLLIKYGQHINVPIDVAYSLNGKRVEVAVKELPAKGVIEDIGEGTVQIYKAVIKAAKTMVVKGPPGVYEDSGFEVGTKEILNAIRESDGFSLVGGGHTLSAIQTLNIDEKGFSHISLGGGALINYLSGRSLPAFESLKQAAERYKA
jgi:phosphoglycerate kinase